MTLKIKAISKLALIFVEEQKEYQIEWLAEIYLRY